MRDVRCYRVTGTQPVVIDGQTYPPGALVETAADVAGLLAIGALAVEPAADTVADAPQEGQAD